MLEKLKNLIKGYRKGPTVFSIPNKDFSYCVVPIFASYFTTRNKFEYDNSKDHIKLYGNKTFEVDNTKIIVIGHPFSDTYEGLIYQNNTLVPSSYFLKSNKELFEVFFGLICYGYKLFQAPNGWNNIASEKITFIDEIATEFDIQLPKVHSLFTKVYNKIYRIIDDHKSGEDLFTKIYDSYDEAFDEIQNEMSDRQGKAVALLYLSDKIEFLTKI